MRRPYGTRSSPRSTRSTASCGASRSSVSSTGCRPTSSTPRPRRADPTRTIGRSICRRKPNLATELGFDAEFIACAPFVNRPAVRFDNQAKFHPRKYLDRAAAAPLRRQRLPGLRADQRRRDRGHADHRDDLQRRADSLRACAHRDARAAAGQVGPAARDASSVEARAVQLVRRRRLGAARHGSRRRSTGIPAIRTTTCASIAGTTTTSSSSAAKITRPVRWKRRRSASAASSSG